MSEFTIPIVGNLLESIAAEFKDRVKPVPGSVLRVDLCGGANFLGGRICHTGIYLGNDEIAEITNVRGKARAHVVDPSDFLNGQGTNFIRTGLNIYVATDGCGRALAAPVRPGKFREDLFMRLNVVQLRVPPLREHLEDIDDIADHWWFGRFRKHLSPEQLAALKDYGYPGNVRELMNLLERAAVLGEGDFARLVAQHREMNAGFEADEEPSSGADVPPELLDEAIRHHVRRIFCKYARNVTRAAAALGISRTTLRKWM